MKFCLTNVRMSQQELSPRLASILPFDITKAHTWREELRASNVSSVLTLSSYYDSSQDLKDCLSTNIGLDLTDVSKLYRAADELAQMALKGAARATIVGHGQLQEHIDSGQTTMTTETVKTEWKERLLMEVQPSLHVRKRKRSDPVQTSVVSARVIEQAKMNAAVDRAIRLAQIMQDHSPRMIRMLKQCLSEGDQKDLLQPLITQRATAPSTLNAHVNVVLAFLAWAASVNCDPWSAPPEVFALYLRDASGRGTSVPKSVWASLDWARHVFELEWPLADPVVAAQKQQSAVKTEEAREQAPAMTQVMLEGLIHLLHGANSCGNSGVCIYVGFVITLALACLRWSDLQKSMGIKLSKDSLYGESWKSKRKICRMPWAAPRRDWHGWDWACVFHTELCRYIDLDTADFVVPAPAQNGARLEVLLPVRPARYIEALNAFRVVLGLLGGVKDPLAWSLHSPRFYFPSLAGQMGLSLEQRRSLGRWGPASGMPVRYDRARCVTELLMKATMIQKLKSGFTPAGDFELPTITDMQTQNDAIRAARAVDQGSDDTESSGLVQIASTVTNPQPLDERLPLILNISSMIVHLECENESGRTMCSFWWSKSKAKVQHRFGKLADVPEFTVCEVCSRRSPIDFHLPKWDGADCAESSNISTSSESNSS